MMRRWYGLAVVGACLMTAGLVSAEDQDGHARRHAAPLREIVYSPNGFKVPYLGLDGTFTIDPQEIAATDPRNPKRIVFSKMETFSFYEDVAGATPLAEECHYAYKGAAGDPFYYPALSKTSIWDLFDSPRAMRLVKTFITSRSVRRTASRPHASALRGRAIQLSEAVADE